MSPPSPLRNRALRLLTLAAGLLALSLTSSTGLARESGQHRHALWRVVHGICLRDARLSGIPAPCMAVDRARGYAVVPDLRSPTQVLLVPTVRLAGIESPELLEPGGANYWQAAWEARRYFERRAARRVSRDDIAMAVNSTVSRSQDQLHIHIDCVRSDVRATLAERQDEITDVFAPLPFTVLGQTFLGRRIEGVDLAGRDPFKLLARGDAFAREHMGLETLVVVGMTFADGSPGFVALSDHVGATPHDPAFGERLLDHSCAVLRHAPSPGT